MIPAAKSSWFENVFSFYNERYLLKKQFHAIAARGNIDAVSQGKPVLYVMNHSSWWDGLLVYAVVRKLSRRGHFMMMDEKQLKQFRFFRRIGAFSVDKTSAKGVLASLRYAERLLKEGSGVWIFPQGDIRHLEERPLAFQDGAGYLLSRVPESAVVPVTAYYTVGGHQKAEAGLWIGDVIEPKERAGFNRNETSELLRERVQTQLDKHRSMAIRAGRGEQMPEFVPLIEANNDTSERFIRMKRGAGKWRSFFGR